MDIEYFDFAHIDDAVYQRILDSHLYDDAFAKEGTGLYGCCIDYFSRGDRSLSHVWITSVVGQDVGICAIRHYGQNTINVYVRPELRGVGFGTQLVQRALELNPRISGVYSDTSAALFRKYKIPNCQDLDRPQYPTNAHTV